MIPNNIQIFILQQINVISLHFTESPVHQDFRFFVYFLTADSAFSPIKIKQKEPTHKLSWLLFKNITSRNAILFLNPLSFARLLSDLPRGHHEKSTWSEYFECHI